MSFWDQHKSSLSVAGLGLFVLLVCYLAVVRGANDAAENHRQAIEENRGQLAKYYLELDNPNSFYRPTIEKVRQDCDRRYKEYSQQLNDLKARLRFPFEEFSDTVVPANEVPGVYLQRRVPDVREKILKNVIAASTSAFNRGLPAGVEGDWLHYEAPKEAVKVSRMQAEEDLRKLCLAERVAMLAIEAGISRVFDVSPEKVPPPEGATYMVPNPKYRPDSMEPKEVPKSYPSHFIVNYPVSMEMTGSIDSAMRLFHSVRQEKRFLVIRSFRIVSREDKELPRDVAEKMRPGEVHVTISAACMDFKESEAKGVLPAPKVETPTGPMGA